MLKSKCPASRRALFYRHRRLPLIKAQAGRMMPPFGRSSRQISQFFQ
jgi:hypothetical protein